MKILFKKWNQLSLVMQIAIGLVIGIVMAVAIPEAAKPLVILGSLFVGALKGLGASRTGAFFSLAPFVGALLSIAIFREISALVIIPAFCLMAIGVWLIITENHFHAHLHQATTHIHLHNHDDLHHNHDHLEECAECHTHEHTHNKLHHIHEHFPDTHHRHKH